MILNPSLQFPRLLRGLWGRTAGTKLPQVDSQFVQLTKWKRFREASSNIQLLHLKGKRTAEETNLPFPCKCFSGL